MAATKRRQRSRKPVVGVLPKELWIVKPLLGVAALILSINVVFHSSLTEKFNKIPLSFKNHPSLLQSSSKTNNQQTSKKSVAFPFRFDRRQAEAMLAKNGAQNNFNLNYRVPITAYLENPMNDIAEGTINQGDVHNKTDVGMPPQFLIPLPLRTQLPEHLQKVVYPSFQTCRDLPSKLPVDRGLQLDDDGNVVPWNVPTEPNPGYDNTPHCPVDADPHLPWIHDIVPSRDGSKLHFVAQNKRRCHTGNNFRELVQHMSPQVSLFQPISIQRISQDEAKRLAPEMYHPDEKEVRYKLADYDTADISQTRFRCIFTATNLTDGSLYTVEETLSIYPFNYEFVSWRRSVPTMINPRGTDKANIYTATLLFDCPVPTVLRPLVASGETVLSDGTPTLHVDVIPIRTSPRYGLDEVHFTEKMAGPKELWHLGNFSRSLWREIDAPLKGFDAKKLWGERHVLPAAAASGRWTNLPICKPEQAVTSTVLTIPTDDEDAAATDQQVNAHTDAADSETSKPYELVACVWASASYATRGTNVAPTNSSLDRITEWLEFALLAGFDHVYVYDNSAANHPTLTLQPVTDLFDDKVTRIVWDHAVCNNNQPNGINPGERSSQYAAENSCRVRFGPLTEWMASFDLDEYLIPMGTYNSLKEVTAAASQHNIIDFRSTRTKLRWEASEPVDSGDAQSPNRKKATVPFLEAYNCDTEPPPKPYSGDRARKELYRPYHVLYHFVHYSLVTRTVATFYQDRSPQEHWARENKELSAPEHQTDEANEAVMLHAKSAKEENHSWRKECKMKKKYKSCVIGFSWPRGMNWTGIEGEEGTNEKYIYSCHENTKVADYWLPKLKKAMQERQMQAN